MTNLQEVICKLQLNNELVVLRTCGSEYQNELLAALTDGYNALDLALPNVRMQVEQNPAAFVRSLPLPVFLQNLHCAPSLLSCLLQNELPRNKIIACCRQSCYLQEQAESFAGKAAFLDLPLTAQVQKPFIPTDVYLAAGVSKRQSKDILPLIVDGSWGQKTAAYVNSLLQHDIMEHTTVKDDIKFFRFLCAAASMAGCVVNYAVLANNVGISAPTAKQWLQFLEGAGAVYFVQPLSTVIAGRRLVKAPKLYFRDTGVAAYLLQIAEAAALLPSVYFKSLYENYLVSRLREGFWQQGLPFPAEFYRDSNNKEITLLLRDGFTMYPVIISSTELKAAKLQRLLSLLQPYIENNNIALGNTVLLALGGQSGRLASGIWRLDAGCL